VTRVCAYTRTTHWFRTCYISDHRCVVFVPCRCGTFWLRVILGLDPGNGGPACHTTLSPSALPCRLPADRVYFTPFSTADWVLYTPVTRSYGLGSSSYRLWNRFIHATLSLPVTIVLADIADEYRALPFIACHLAVHARSSFICCLDTYLLPGFLDGPVLLGAGLFGSTTRLPITGSSLDCIVPFPDGFLPNYLRLADADHYRYSFWFCLLLPAGLSAYLYAVWFRFYRCYYLPAWFGSPVLVLLRPFAVVGLHHRFWTFADYACRFLLRGFTWTCHFYFFHIPYGCATTAIFTTIVLVHSLRHSALPAARLYRTLFVPHTTRTTYYVTDAFVVPGNGSGLVHRTGLLPPAVPDSSVVCTFCTDFHAPAVRTACSSVCALRFAHFPSPFLQVPFRGSVPSAYLLHLHASLRA